MRRSGAVGLIALLLVALVGTSVSARPGPTFVGRAGIGEVGGTLLVRAKIRHAKRSATFSASALVFFAGLEAEPVSVELVRRGRSFVARARVAVPEDQPVGLVPVTISIVHILGDVTTTADISTSGRIVAPEPDDDDEEDEDEDPGDGQQDT